MKFVELDKPAVILLTCFDKRNRKAPTCLERFYGLPEDGSYVFPLKKPGGAHNAHYGHNEFVRDVAEGVVALKSSGTHEFAVVIADHDDCAYVKCGLGHRHVAEYWSRKNFVARIFNIDPHIKFIDILKVNYVDEKKPKMRSSDIVVNHIKRILREEKKIEVAA